MALQSQLGLSFGLEPAPQWRASVQLADEPRVHFDSARGLTARHSYADLLREGSPFGATQAARAIGLEDFFAKLITFWDITHQQAAALAGFHARDAGEVARIISGLAKLDGVDKRDRMLELFAIRKLLAGLYRNRDVERLWLRTPNEGLGGNTPFQIMRTGFAGLLRVRQLLEHAAGI